METIKGWLGDAASRGLLALRQESSTVRETILGEMAAPSLVLEFQGRTLRVVPVGCEEVGDPWGGGWADAQVNLTDRFVELPIFHRETPGGDYWYFGDQPEEGPRVLNRETFEEALIELLSN